jgi:hypothetical protein
LLFLSFPILRSEFYRYRQNPNGIIKHLFQFEPSKAAILSAITELLVGSFEINPAWPFGQREGHNSGHRRMVNSFLKKKFQRPDFWFSKINHSALKGLISSASPGF